MNKIKEIFKKEDFKTTISLFSLVIITGILLFATGKSLGDPNSTVLKDQEVGSLEFKNANVEYVDGVSTLTVELVNTGEDTSLKYVDILVEVEEETYRLIGYVGDGIKTNEEKNIVASIDQDITNMKSITYIPVK